MRSLIRFSAAAALGVVVTGASAHAAVLFQDSFDYADGNLVGNGTWQTKSAVSDPVNVASGQVSLTGAGDDVLATISPAIPFDASNPGYTFYEAADITVSAARSGDYVLHTSASAASSSFQGRLYVKSSGTGFVFGAGVTSETALYGTQELNLDQTYRVVLRYDMVPGAGNDQVGVYVDPGDSEPAGFYVSKTQSGSGDASGLGSVNLRQGSGTAGPDLTIDNLVVADTFASTVVAVPEPASAGLLLLGASGLLAARRRRRTRHHSNPLT